MKHRCLHYALIGCLGVLSGSLAVADPAVSLGGTPDSVSAVQLPSSQQTQVPTRRNPVDGEELCFVPSGEFLMGSNDLGKPYIEHKVTLDAYWIYRTPVTVAQYRKFCKMRNRQMPPAPDWGWRDSDPIVNVSWQDASDYADYANASLPTEAQWEKAARGTDGRRYPWGDDWLPERCVNAPTTGQHPRAVGSFPSGASPFGVLDMAGNVWEWCSDVYDSKYYSVSPAANPTGPESGSIHVLRGGSWCNVKAKTFRSAYRYCDGIYNFDESYGFRCVCPGK